MDGDARGIIPISIVFEIGGLAKGTIPAKSTSSKYSIL